MSTRRVLVLSMGLLAMVLGCGGASGNRDAVAHDDTSVDIGLRPDAAHDVVAENLPEPVAEAPAEPAVEQVEIAPDVDAHEIEATAEIEVAPDVELQPEVAIEVTPDEGPEAADTVEAVDACVPSCGGNECGDDGCSGSCGSCAEHFACEAGACVHVPWCGDGTCDANETCSDCNADCSCALPDVCFDGACCTPATCDAQAFECGSLEAGCGVVRECGACDDHFQCAAGKCIYQPWCGDGNCDGVLVEDCSTCPGDCGCLCGESCLAGVCTFTACDGKACGDDGCGGDCGTCPWNLSQCIDGQCACEPDCSLVECGHDGCGGACGTCGVGETCAGGGRCEPGVLEFVTPGFILLRAGSFWMGSPGAQACPAGYAGGGCPASGLATAEGGRDGNEVLHYVRLTNAFELQTAEVTQEQWASTFGWWNPSYFPAYGDARPVENVTWYDAAAYANTTSLQAGRAACYAFASVSCSAAGDPPDGTDAAFCMDKVHQGIKTATVTLNGVATPYLCTGFRLPTEAEWEYAYRAGGTTAFYTSAGNDGSIVNPGFDCNPDANLDHVGWYCGNAAGTTHPGAGLDANAWGFRDLAGNVREWCSDWYAGYPAGTLADPVNDPHQAEAGEVRIARGGSWMNDARSARAAARYGTDPVSRLGLGFRLARSVPDPGDADGDGVAAGADNCPTWLNPDQADLDGDGMGDACDVDADGDGASSQAAGGADCDDRDEAVHPEAIETCNGNDDDCDGKTDEGAAVCGADASCVDGACSGAVWVEPTSGLVWQRTWGGNLPWVDAVAYCAGNQPGLPGAGWHLPTISELRSLIRGCEGTITGGACQVTDGCPYPSCWSMETCYICDWDGGPASGCYWDANLQGDCAWYSSSSPTPGSPDAAWVVDFDSGRVWSSNPVGSNGVRCVRSGH